MTTFAMFDYLRKKNSEKKSGSICFELREERREENNIVKYHFITLSQISLLVLFFNFFLFLNRKK